MSLNGVPTDSHRAVPSKMAPYERAASATIHPSAWTIEFPRMRRFKGPLALPERLTVVGSSALLSSPLPPEIGSLISCLLEALEENRHRVARGFGLAECDGTRRHNGAQSTTTRSGNPLLQYVEIFRKNAKTPRPPTRGRCEPRSRTSRKLQPSTPGDKSNGKDVCEYGGQSSACLSSPASGTSDAWNGDRRACAGYGRTAKRACVRRKASAAGIVLSSCPAPQESE